MTNKEKSKDQWAIHLLPLLSDRCRTVAINLEADQRKDYDVLKEHLSKSDNVHSRDAGQIFWSMYKDHGMSMRDYSQKLLRALKRFAIGDNRDDILNSILKERLIQELPKETRTYVRDKQPETPLQVCLEAE